MDETALLAELATGRIYAVLDVTEPEPPAAEFWTRPFTGYAPLEGSTNGHDTPAESLAAEGYEVIEASDQSANYKGTDHIGKTGLEQKYEFDLLSADRLLEKYIDKTLRDLKRRPRDKLVEERYEKIRKFGADVLTTA